MNVLDAFYHTVHDYPGGSESLAPRMGMTPAILNNKADPKKEHNKPLLVDADNIIGLTGDFRVLQALAHKHGFLLVKAPSGAGDSSDMAVLEQVVGLGVANGQFMQTIHSALADGRVDESEMKRIRAAERELQTVAATVTQRMEGMAE
ncbi:MAG TPA: phage regulatory CII family protein [Burkholderiaceae bacterium]|nr:phage regulatory CII family protein [Burkholderiaceae bacterium]